MKYVISLGGSIIVPGGEIATDFISRFARLIMRFVKRGDAFFIVTGGGATARKYVTAAKKLSVTVSDFDLDWMGISATKLNAQLLTAAFGKFARRGIINDPSEANRYLRKVNVVSGWKPGWSTDFVATRIAQIYKIPIVINLSNIDYVYDKDPRFNRSVKKFFRLTWREFNRKFGRKWSPSAHVPFDPVATKLAQKLGLKVIVMNGRKLRNLQNFFLGRPFRGTIVE